MILPSHLTREETAVRGRCSRDSVDRAIKTGALEAVKVGKRVLIPRAACARWLEGVSHTQSAAKEAAQSR